MSESFDLDEVDHLTTGTVGPPGQRVFYIQLRGDGRLVTLKAEKTQVAALITYLRKLLADLPAPDEIPFDMDLIEPVVADWVIGSLGVSYDDEADRILLLAEEMVEEGEEGAHVRILATREQVAALSEHGGEVVQAGRPPCALCGQPLDPEGHVCLRLNGHPARVR